MQDVDPDGNRRSLRFRLKAATDALHRETERLFALETRISAQSSYRDLLIALYGFHAPLEERLARVDFCAALEMPERLTKSAWIASDLAALGMDRKSIDSIAPCNDLPELGSPAAAMGVLYVVEGATLGGQIIMGALKDRLGLTPQKGARFFSSYGSAIGPMWRRFVVALDEEGRNTRAVDLIERAAAATFRAFAAWLPPLPQAANV